MFFKEKLLYYNKKYEYHLYKEILTVQNSVCRMGVDYGHDLKKIILCST